MRGQVSVPKEGLYWAIVDVSAMMLLIVQALFCV